MQGQQYTRPLPTGTRLIYYNEEGLRSFLLAAYNLRSEWITHPITNRNKGVSDDGFV
jgi:hypothetical protein